jgi:hypothetical protein
MFLCFGIIIIGLTFIFLTTDNRNEYFSGRFLGDYQYQVGKDIFNLGLMVSPYAAIAGVSIVGFLIASVCYLGITKQ